MQRVNAFGSVSWRARRRVCGVLTACAVLAFGCARQDSHDRAHADAGHAGGGGVRFGVAATASAKVRIGEPQGQERAKRSSSREEDAASLSPCELRELLSGLRHRLDSAEDGWRDRLFCCLTRFEPAEAVKLAEDWPDPAMRGHVVRVVAEAWLQFDVQAASEWLARSVHKVLVEQLAPRMVSQLELIDRKAAAALIGALPAGEVQSHLLDGLLSGWSGPSLEDALRWARELPEGSLKNRALLHLAGHWIERDPLQALSYADDVAPRMGPQLREFMIGELARRAPQTAANWAMQLPDARQRTSAMGILVAAWAQRAPVDAVGFAASLPPGEARTEAVASALSGWARRDPVAAVQWADQFPFGEFRDQAYAQVFAAWVDRDAASAAEWLAMMPEVPGRDAALSSFSGSIVDRYPAIALVFAQSIVGEPGRSERIENVARRWLAVDRERASLAIARSHFPPDMISRLLPAP